MTGYVLFTAFALLTIFGAVRDVQSFTIPNWISLALAGLFIPAAFIAGIGWAAAGLHLAVGFAALLIGMAMFALRWLGGGDAKLLAAAALWMGWPDVLPFLALVAVFGGIFTLVLMVARRHLTPVAQGFGWSLPILERSRDIPYGVAIAAAAIVYFARSALGTALL